MKTSTVGMKRIVSSALWITVLVVRVGCIIEAHPFPSNGNNGHKSSHFSFLGEAEGDDHHEIELDTAASHSFLSSPRNGLLGGGLISDSILSPRKQSSTLLPHQQRTNDDDRKAGYISPKGPILETTTLSFSRTSTTTTAPSSSSSSLSSRSRKEETGSSNGHLNDDDSLVERESGVEEDTDGCSKKADGYYQNFGSGCTSYYYCAAGYQITYVCPPGSKFNGKRCESDYKCPTITATGHRISNDCENRSNGYYPSKTIGKYFYCFQQAKVIELQCDAGKIFKKNKCVLYDDGEAGLKKNGNGSRESDHEIDDNDTTCSQKSNGFYQDLTSDCKTYYYCIGGEKHELRCQDEYIFNGDICVHLSRYQCPKIPKSHLTSSAPTDHNETRKDIRRLPIIGRETGSSDEAGGIYISSLEGETVIGSSSSSSTISPSHLQNNVP